MQFNLPSQSHLSYQRDSNSTCSSPQKPFLGQKTCLTFPHLKKTTHFILQVSDEELTKEQCGIFHMVPKMQKPLICTSSQGFYCERAKKDGDSFFYDLQAKAVHELQREAVRDT
mmetsp:Transcript_2377/g.8939  ORF Transcript_2377/g.8939 Transcript_2377/m.8939 type:complete len:114 (-) Transcript_2377:1230-1571(-)